MSSSNTNYTQVTSNDGAFFIEINEKIKTSSQGVGVLTPEELDNVNNLVGHIQKDPSANDIFLNMLSHIPDPTIVAFWSDAMQKVIF